MKRKVIFLLFLFFLFATVLSHAQSTLEVSVRDCRSKERNGFAYLSSFEVFKNDRLWQTVKVGHEGQKSLPNLQPGTYRIDFRSIFDKTESVSVDITEERTYSVDLCLDYLDHTSDSYVPIIHQLKEGEAYTIEMSSQGCFHSSRDHMTVSKRSGIYFLVYGKKTKQLSPADMEAIAKFEIELRHIKFGGCTTVDTYVISYQDYCFRIQDGGCAWNGGVSIEKKAGAPNRIKQF